jgi:hypothetical protein
MPELRLQGHIKCSNFLDPILLYVKLPAPRFSGTVKVEWSYLSRAIDRDDNLVDSLLNETPDLEATRCFFKQAVDVVGHVPEW